MEKINPAILIRYSQPNNMDQAAYGTFIKVKRYDGCIDVYRQLSHDEEQPDWIHVGIFAIDDDSWYAGT